ncbi:amidohydrolase family protein [Gallaecimonas mangrovi]|uniref:amidohydrolase family protein n=1 Tax=Gallaecimonas mangrovi TaxID=2291597 RepID=UPI000E203449|nr:amidohydrolase family protein [Gallaecimonas mangrovi]
MKPSCLAVSAVDCHAHVFTPSLPMVSGRRYTPDYQATVQDYLANLDQFGMSHGVLVQPSFLGTDNHYLMAAAATVPDRLRAIVVVEPSITDNELEQLDSQGAVGVRLNLIGKSAGDYQSPLWQDFFKRLKARNWSLQIQCHVDELASFLPNIIESGVNVVIDHFGRPTDGINPDNPLHHAFLAQLSSPQLWVKLSASYRNDPALSPSERLQRAKQMHALLRSAMGGSGRFLWGSDWPHTQFEDQTSYQEQYQAMDALLSNTAEKKQVLVDNPKALFQLA